jgi:hypothetical protein
LEITAAEFPHGFPSRVIACVYNNVLCLPIFTQAGSGRFNVKD